MKKLSLTLLLPILAIFGLNAQNANVQVIHNSPDPLFGTVDVYIDSVLVSDLDDLSFREATPFSPVSAGDSVAIGLAPSNSTGPSDILISVKFPPLTAGTNYVISAIGVADTALPDNPEGISTDFQLSVVGGGPTSSTSGNVSLLVAHGAPDAPSVNVNLLGLDQTPIASIDSISYAEYSSQNGNPAYSTLPANDILVNLSATFSGTDIATYYAPLSALDSSAAVVFASGFVDPQQTNSFGLFVATPQGDVIELPVIGSRIQIIHNSADTAASEVDVYVVEKFTGNDGIIAAFDDFAFRQATASLPFPSELPFRVYIAPSNSTSIADSIAAFDFPSGLEVEKVYSVIANGVLNPSDYAANPGGASTAFDLYIYDEARVSAIPSSNVNVLAFHGATDAPTVDIDIREESGTEVDNISYGEFSPNGYASFPPADVTVDVNDETGTTTVASFSASVSAAVGFAVTVFASGFLDSTANNNGASFGLYAALPGSVTNPNSTLATVLPLPRLTTTGVFLAEEDVFNELSLFPNPSSDFLRINYNMKETTDFSVRFVDVNGKTITTRDLGRVSSGSNNVEFNVSDLAPGTYFVQMILNEKDFIVKPVVVGTK